MLIGNVVRREENPITSSINDFNGIYRNSSETGGGINPHLKVHQEGWWTELVMYFQGPLVK